MTSTPTYEPAEITAGDTLTWRITLADYPAGTWTLKYRLINAAGKIDITAGTDGTDHLVSVAAATSANYTAGKYAFTAWVEKTGERHTLYGGNITVKPNIAALNTLDARTDAEKIVAAITAAYQTYVASNGHVQEYEIAGRRVRYRSAAEILEQLNFWETRAATERRAARLAAGQPSGNKLMVRF